MWKRFAILLTIGTLAGCGPGICVDQFCVNSPAHLSLGFTEANFGTRAFGATYELQVILSNTGGSPASGLAVVGIQPPFAFKGGTFPGTGGSCAFSLAAGQSCLMVLQFTAPGIPFAKYGTSLVFTYFDGRAEQTITLPITGISDNGVFNPSNGPDGFVYGLRSIGGYTYVGGTINSYGKNFARGAIRLNSNDEPDPNAMGAATGFGLNSAENFAAANDGSGDVYVGGSFFSYRGTPQTVSSESIAMEATTRVLPPGQASLPLSAQLHPRTTVPATFMWDVVPPLIKARPSIGWSASMPTEA